MSAWKRHFLRELRRILTDKRIALTMLAGPFLYGFLFGGVYSAGRIRHVPIVIVDQDHSALSRDFTGALLASENLSLVFYGGSPEDFYRAAKRSQAYACVVIPKDLQRDVVRGAGGRVIVILDGSNILVGNMTSRTIAGTISAYRVGARARRLMAIGVPRSQAMSAALPIQPVIRPLYNPASHYGFFILVGLVAVAIQQVTRMGTAIALNLEAEAGSSSELSGIGGRPWTILTAKAAATAMTALPLAFVAIRLPFDLFGSPFRGSWATGYAVLALFVVTQVLIGCGIAGLCRSGIVSLHLLLFASVPLFTLTGFTWPVSAMPSWLQAVSWLIPLTHFLEIFRGMALMGAGFGALWPHMAVLLAWAPAAALWAHWAVKETICRETTPQP
jgi:ABC-2 type transport system permease protein